MQHTNAHKPFATMPTPAVTCWIGVSARGNALGSTALVWRYER